MHTMVSFGECLHLGMDVGRIVLMTGPLQGLAIHTAPEEHACLSH